ncbi:hypothetical protein ACWGJ9_10550 [Curtobacterium citreum]
MSRTDYWGDVVPTVRVEEVWEYELAADPEQQNADGVPVRPHWIREDDKMSAMWKAVGDRATGRIRSYTRTTAESEPVVEQGLTLDELLALYRQG